MAERQGFTGGQLLIAVAVGAAVGAAVALLLTPNTGAELRARIKDLAAASKERARDAFVGTLDGS